MGEQSEANPEPKRKAAANERYTSTLKERKGKNHNLTELP